MKRVGARWGGPLLVSLLFCAVGCRDGDIAGTGAACGTELSCRPGYRCVQSRCRPQVPPAIDASEDRGPPHQPNDAAAQVDGPEITSDAGDVGSPPDAARPDEVVTAGGPPSLASCTELFHVRSASACRPGQGIQTGPIAFSTDGRFLATSARDWGAKVWEVGNSFAQYGSAIPTRSLTTALALAPDGRWLALSGFENAVWRVQTDPAREVWAPDAFWSNGITFAPDGDRLLVAGLEVWSIARKAVVKKFPVPDLLAFAAGTTPGQPWWVAVAAVGGLNDNQVGFVDLDQSTPKLVSFRVNTPPNHSIALVLTPDSQTLAVATAAGVELHDVRDKSAARFLRRLPWATTGPSDGLPAMAFSPSGQHLAVAPPRTASADRTVAIFEVASGQPTARRTFDDIPLAPVFSPDGHTLAIPLITCGRIMMCR